MFVSAIAFRAGAPKVQQIVEAFSQAIENGEWRRQQVAVGA